MSDDQPTSRRSFISSAAASAGSVVLATTAAGAADTPKDAGMPVAPAFQSSETLNPLPFDPAKVPGLSERMLKSHWENNYGGSVKALAAVKKRLADMQGDKDLPPYVYNDLKREHFLRTGSVVFHEYYFESLGGSGQAGAAERQRIASAFGSFDAWE